MNYLLQQLSKVHEYIWPVLLVGMWQLDRRLRALERLESVISAQLELVLRSHHLANGASHDHVRIFPP